MRRSARRLTTHRARPSFRIRSNKNHVTLSNRAAGRSHAAFDTCLTSVKARPDLGDRPLVVAPRPPTGRARHALRVTGSRKSRMLAPRNGAQRVNQVNTDTRAHTKTAATTGLGPAARRGIAGGDASNKGATRRRRGRRQRHGSAVSWVPAPVLGRAQAQVPAATAGFSPDQGQATAARVGLSPGGISGSARSSARSGRSTVKATPWVRGAPAPGAGERRDGETRSR
jgi:hypothetical protein